MPAQVGPKVLFERNLNQFLETCLRQL